MKKLLSAVLAVAMLMTVILAVPAQAAPSASYPYVFVDFEDGTLGPNTLTPAQSMASWSAGGAGGSNGASRMSSTGSATGQGGLFYTVDIPVEIGDQFAVSAWVKFETPATNVAKKIGFHVRANVTYTNTETGEAATELKSWNEKIDCSAQYVLNEWIFVSGVITADNGDFAKAGHTYSDIEIVEVRPYAGNVSGTSDIDRELAPDATAFAYYMDDISYAKVDPATTAIGVKNIAKDDLINGDFESFTANANIITRSGAGWGFTSYNYAAKAKKYSESDPRPAGMAATSNTYMHVPLSIAGGNNAGAAEGYGYSELFIDQYGATTNHMLELKPGRTYKVDFWVRANGDETCTVAKYNPVFVQTVGIVAGGVVDEAQSIPVDVNGFRNSAAAQTKEYVMDGIEVVTNGGWQHVEYYLQFDHKASTSRPMPIALQLRPVGGSGTKILGASFDYDEIQILDLGPIANGDFEIGETANVRYYWAGKNTNTTQSVLGWTPSLADGVSLDKPNATLSQADEVRPGTTGTKSMKVAVTANGGSLYRAVGLENGKQYKISFWAKGNNMATNMYMMAVLNRTGTVAPNESYTMPTTQYIWGADPAQTGTSQPPLVQRWKVTNEWQKYEFVYDNTFPLKEGLTQANAYTFPKVPWLQLNMLNTSAAAIPAGTEFFLDDFVVEEIEAGAPVVVGAKTTGNATPDTEVAADYSFAANGATDASYVKLLAKVGNNYASLGTYAANAAITVPEAAIGKELALEIVPVGSNGKVGEAIIVPIAAAGNWAKIYVDADLTSRVYASAAKPNAQVIYAAYTTEANGTTKRLVSSGIAPAALTANNKVEINDLPDGFSYAGADTVKIMLWDGLNNVTPLCEFVEVPVPAAE